MSIKNIIVYSNGLPPDQVGGMESNAYYFISYLAEQPQYKLGVVTQTKKLLEKSRSLKFSGSTIKAHVAKKKLFKQPKSVLKIFARTGFKPQETVIFHNSLDLHGSYEALSKAGYHQVARSGGNDVFFMQKKEKGSGAFARHLDSLQALFVNSEYSLARSAEAGVSEGLLRVVKGGCDAPVQGEVDVLSNLPADKKLILTCGRLVDFKGIEDALDAMALLKLQRQDFLYVIVGDGELRSALELQVADLGLQDQCLFVGKVQPSVVLAYYQACGIYLSSSKGVQKQHEDYQYIHTETMGRSICEAQINGLPVVATNAGGSSEMLVDGETGMVVAEGSAPQMAEALNQIMSDEGLAKQFATVAVRNASENLSWQAVFKAYLETIDQL